MAQPAPAEAVRHPGRIDARAAAGSLGADIYGADLTRLDDQTFAEIHRALLDYQVIYIRDQQLDSDQFLAFAKRWGRIAIYPYMKGLESHPEILEILKSETDTYAFGSAWHTDSSFLAIPPKITMLYALEIPPAGGDTQFANMYLAYDRLSDGMKAMIDPLKVLCVGDQPVVRFKEVAGMTQRDPGDTQVKTYQPLVRTHPETGRKGLYIGAHSVEIEGMTKEESAPILNYLKAHSTRPEFTCRFRWAPGSISIWDNRCTQHNAIDDYSGHRRRMHRIIIEGDEAPY